jgi:hypothetical protein
MNDSKFIEDALTLKNIDQDVLIASKNVTISSLPSLLTLLTRFSQIKKRLQGNRAEASAIPVEDPEVKSILQTLNPNSIQTFYSDDIISVIETYLGASFQELTDYEIDELGSKLLYTWISHHEYVSDLFKISTLIIRKDAPKHLSIYIKEAKNCYAFQQYNAVLTLSRTILEAAAKDLCFAINPFLSKPKKFNKAISTVSSEEEIKERANRLYGDTSDVVHGKKVVTKQEAATVFTKTIAIIQELYSTHGL